MEKTKDCGRCSLFEAWFAGGEHVKCLLHGDPDHEFIVDRKAAAKCRDYDGEKQD